MEQFYECTNIFIAVGYTNQRICYELENGSIHSLQLFFPNLCDFQLGFMIMIIDFDWINFVEAAFGRSMCLIYLLKQKLSDFCIPSMDSARLLLIIIFSQSQTNESTK